MTTKGLFSVFWGTKNIQEIAKKQLPRQEWKTELFFPWGI